jgi:hypothetical protein
LSLGTGLRWAALHPRFTAVSHLPHAVCAVLMVFRLQHAPTFDCTQRHPRRDLGPVLPRYFPRGVLPLVAVVLAMVLCVALLAVRRAYTRDVLAVLALTAAAWALLGR